MHNDTTQGFIDKFGVANVHRRPRTLRQLMPACEGTENRLNLLTLKRTCQAVD